MTDYNFVHHPHGSFDRAQLPLSKLPALYFEKRSSSIRSVRVVRRTARNSVCPRRGSSGPGMMLVSWTRREVPKHEPQNR